MARERGRVKLRRVTDVMKPDGWEWNQIEGIVWRNSL